MEYDSTNDQPPDFAPGFPVYPPLDQLVQPFSAAIPGSDPPVYPAYMIQLDPVTLTVRQREVVYVLEPNRVPLTLSVYDARLVGAFPPSNPDGTPVPGQKPLFATTCCVAGGFSSASSAAAAPPLGPVTRTALGTTSQTVTGMGATVTLGTFVIPAGAQLLVQVGVVTAAAFGVPATPQVRFAGDPMSRDGNPPDLTVSGLGLSVNNFSFAAAAQTSGQVVVTVNVPVGSALVLVSAVYVTGLAVQAFDQTASADGLLGTPDTGATGTTAAAKEYCQAAFLLMAAGSFTWGGSFTSGGQDVADVIAGVTFTLTEGYRVLSATGTARATLSMSPPTAWDGVLDTYF